MATLSKNVSSALPQPPAASPPLPTRSRSGNDSGWWAARPGPRRVTPGLSRPLEPWCERTRLTRQILFLHSSTPLPRLYGGAIRVQLLRYTVPIALSSGYLYPTGYASATILGGDGFPTVSRTPKFKLLAALDNNILIALILRLGKPNSLIK